MGLELVQVVSAWRVSSGRPNAHAVRRSREAGSFGAFPDALSKMAAVLKLARVWPELARRTLRLAVFFEAIIVVGEIPVDILAISGFKKYSLS